MADEGLGSDEEEEEDDVRVQIHSHCRYIVASVLVKTCQSVQRI